MRHIVTACIIYVINLKQLHKEAVYHEIEARGELQFINR